MFVFRLCVTLEVGELAQVGTSLNRQAVTQEDIVLGIIQLETKLTKRLEQKGYGAYASRHEILGILEEEMIEVKEAIREDDQEGHDHYAQELMDVAVGALFGFICLHQGYIQP